MPSSISLYYLLSVLSYLCSPPLSGTAPKKRSYDLNTQTDGFLLRHAGSPFPEAVEANEVELAEVRSLNLKLKLKISLSIMFSLG